MAQSFTTTGGTLIIPSAVSSYQVLNGGSGLATSGVVFLVGEADAGPDYTLEPDLNLNVFGPSQLSDVVAKYKSGPIVDAFRIAAAPANDPDIQGAPGAFIIVKTNPSGKASSGLLKVNGGAYATLFDKSYGQIGNLIYYTIAAATAEVKPTTGAFTYIPPVGTVSYSLRVNGGAEVTRTTVAAETPTAFVAGTGGLTGISCTGGVNRAVLNAAHGQLAVGGIVGNSAVFTLSVIANWDTTPTVGDTLMIPAGSAIAGAGNANVGAYVITAVSTTTITATKLSDAAKPAAAIGVITAPVTVAATNVIGANADLVAYSPVTITQSLATMIDGEGKSLEINQTTSGTDLLNRTAFQLGTTTAVTWVSATGAPQLLVSAAEYSVTLNDQRQLDSVDESVTAGGKIALLLGYTGTSCSVVTSATSIVLTPIGGASGGTVFTLLFSQYPTISDLAAYINGIPGFKCAVGNTSLGQYSPTALDEATYAAGTTFGAYTLRLKMDAALFATAIAQNLSLVQLNNPVSTPACGLPAVTSATTWLAGGSRGGTTDAVFNAGLDALEQVPGNFLVPLMSADAATEKLYTVNPTDSTSTYTIANIQAYSKTHCLKMAQLKRRKNRQAFLAQRDTFANVQVSAQNLASARCSLSFQDVKAVGANGVTQFQPHMLAAFGAGMQAAAFYKALVRKGINCSGVVQGGSVGVVPDFSDRNDGQMEQALLAGLLVAKKAFDGGYIWVSDQTTYSKDNNFVYNSIQAVYVADIIALTLAQRMEKAFVGQSVADITAPVALAALEAIMADFLRLKLIAASTDAPKGYKNASIKMSGPTMLVSVEVKLAGAIYFINIPFLVSMVQQSA